MAGKTAILAVRIISSAKGKGFRKAAREVELFNSRMKKFQAGMKKFTAPLAAMGRAVGRVAAPVAKFGTIAAGATTAIAGLAVPIAAMGSAAGAALGPMIALTAAMAPAAIGALGLAVGALSMAFKGMGAAMSASNPAELAEALEGMGPAAASAATALNGLAGRFRDLGTEVQESFWKNVSNIGDLGVLIKPIGDALNGVAADMGNAAAGLVDFVSHGTGLTAMKTLISESGAAASGLGDAFAGVVKGIISVGAAAAPILTELTSGMAEAAAGWGDKMAAGFADGSLQQYFRDAQAAGREFGAVLSDVGGIIGGVWSAMAAAGQPMLGVIRDAVGATNEWVNSAQGMSMLTEWFTQMAGAVGAVMPIVGQLAQIVVGTLSPAFADLVTTVAPALSQIVEMFGQILAVVTPLLGPIGQIVALLGETFAGALGALMPVITQVAAILQQGLQAAFVALQPIMPVIVDAFAQLAAGMQPLMPAFQQLVAAVVALIPHLVNAASAVIPALVSILTALAPVIAGVVQGFADFLGAVGPVISVVASLVGGALTALAAILRVVASVLQPVIRFTVNMALQFGTAVGAVSRVKGAISGAIGVFKSIGNAISTVVGFVQRLISALGSLKFPSPPSWLTSLFSAPEDPTITPPSYGQFAYGNAGGFLKMAAATPAPATVAPITVNVNVRGAVVADEVQLAETVTRALRAHGRINGTTTAVGARR